MTVWGITMLKDEEDVAEHVLRHMLDEGMDGFVVADNMSTDGTQKAICRAEKMATRIGVQFHSITDDEPGYYQSKKMTALANKAHDLGAEWIVPFDADEIWYARADRLAVVLRGVNPSKNVVKVTLTNHFGTILDNADEPNPFVRLGWRQAEPAPLHKIAFRWEPGCVIEQGNHAVTMPSGMRVSVRPQIEIRHFPYRSFEHFKRKAINGAKAYEATDLPIDMGAHWRSYGKILEERGEDELRKVFEEYFWFASPTDAGLLYDPAPFRRW